MTLTKISLFSLLLNQYITEDFLMSWKEILVLITSVILVLYGVVTTIVGLIKNKNTTTEYSNLSNKEKVYYKMLELIVASEKNYDIITSTIKSLPGTSTTIDCGDLKLNYVLTNLQTYALTIKYDFDIEYWTEQINSIIKLTKEVN